MKRWLVMYFLIGSLEMLLVHWYMGIAPSVWIGFVVWPIAAVAAVALLGWRDSRRRHRDRPTARVVRR